MSNAELARERFHVVRKTDARHVGDDVAQRGGRHR